MSPPTLHICLYTPEIPQNTGAIGRLCVNLGARLHLVEPLGFSLEERYLRKAGLDYWEHLDLEVHPDWDHFLTLFCEKDLRFASTKGTRTLYQLSFSTSDVLVFGRESSGLPERFYDRYREQLFQIPMPGRFHRSLNLATAVGVVAYEYLRQTRFTT